MPRAAAKMTHKVTVIHVDGPNTTELCNHKTEYRVLRNAVEGYIETVPHFTRYEGRPCRAFCNEYGITEQLAFNPVATQLWVDVLDHRKGKLWYKPMLLGNVAIIQKLPEAT